jgi:hypothetical protein
MIEILAATFLLSMLVEAGSRTKSVSWKPGSRPGCLVGWRVMRLDPERGVAVSGANARISVPLEPGGIHRMPGAGMFLTHDREYAIRHYANHDVNALLSYEFYPEDVTTGSLEDRETEISVPVAMLRSVEAFDEDGSPVPLQLTRQDDNKDEADEDEDEDDDTEDEDEDEDQDDEDEIERPKTITLEAGTVWYHGTSTPEHFTNPRGPFWVSDGEGVAREFVSWHSWSEGEKPRILTFELQRNVSDIVVIENEGDFEKLSDFAFEQTGIESGGSIDELARALEAAGFAGWHCPHNYPSGSDTVFFDPSVLDLIETEEIE